eukprot:6358407-Prymnesium_polylepis.1
MRSGRLKQIRFELAYPWMEAARTNFKRLYRMFANNGYVLYCPGPKKLGSIMMRETEESFTEASK